MSIYDYEYNDIIKAQNIINSVRAICDKEADNNKEDTVEFLKYNNMARNCTSTWLLLNYYGDKIKDFQKLKDIRNIILNSLINDFKLDIQFDIDIVNEPCGIIFKVKNNPFSTMKRVIEVNSCFVGISTEFSDKNFIYAESLVEFKSNKESVIKSLSQILLNTKGLRTKDISRVLNEIKDQITSRSVIPIHHYMEVAGDLVLFKLGDTVYNLIDTHDNIILYKASDVSCIASHYKNPVYKKSLIDYEANKDMVYNDLIMHLYNLCNKHNCNELHDKEHKDFQLNVINEIYTFIKKHTNICEKLNVIIDFASGTLDFISLDFKKIYAGLSVKRDVRIVNASENYKTLYSLDYEIYKNDKEQFYKDLYTILVLNFNECLKQE